MLLDLHLAGFKKSEWSGQEEPPGRKHNATWGWKPALAAIEDRTRFDNSIAGQSLVDIEDLLARLRELTATPPSAYEAEAVKNAHRQNVEHEAEFSQIYNRIRTRVLRFLSVAEGDLVQPTKASPEAERTTLSGKDGKKRVFIGHGRSKAWLELKTFLEDRLDLAVLEFNRISPAGVTTTARLTEMLGQADFAFLLLTGEDRQADGSVAARDNVIHELGLFQGKLGERRAIAVLEDGCNEFSNIEGLGQIRFSRNQLAYQFEQFREVLEREGIV